MGLLSGKGERMLAQMRTQYVVVDPLSSLAGNIAAVEERLLEMGMHREAFTVTTGEDGRTRLKFWEPDRVEALRILARLDGQV
ncbi:hypothetical protein AGR2A_pb10113 [Agrobacterium genomosp. 2 str. CFBP 5494]|uniref:Uncharacterized protein n=2 Tax=Agrobacterium tumefaciens complex TaxID=1183400 RepID=A0A9W5B7N2_9HYPH|nr:hypothetical protein AGR2A_pb10113 [Agrobacterium genomosp. 2 str. CFBP 5494]